MWTDAHAHLAGLDKASLTSTLARAADAGVSAVLNTGTDLATSAIVLEQAMAHPLLRCAVGISPFDALDLPPDWQEQLARLASQPGVVAIGESGLDTSNPRYPPLEAQMALLAGHAKIALQLDLPLVVHSRGAEQLVARTCADLGLRQVVFHCFTGDLPAVETVLSCGYWVSLSGIVTFAARPLDRIAITVPLDRLLLETDSPYLAPVPHRGKTNEPAFVAPTGACVAALRGVTADALAAGVRSTFEGLFGSTA